MIPGGLVCPYSRCGKPFEQPVLVTDRSKLPRETYYACPHCMLRLELSLDEELGHVQIKPVSDDWLLSQMETLDSSRRLGEPVSNPQATRPSKTCRHFLGYLKTRPESLGIPDECAVCPSIVQCYIKRE